MTTQNYYYIITIYLSLSFVFYISKSFHYPPPPIFIVILCTFLPPLTARGSDLLETV